MAEMEKIMETKKWQKISDDEVRHLYSCSDDECAEYGKIITIYPTFYGDSGTPICNGCDDDLSYIGTEVLL